LPPDTSRKQVALGLLDQLPLALFD